MCSIRLQLKKAIKPSSYIRKGLLGQVMLSSYGAIFRIRPVFAFAFPCVRVCVCVCVVFERMIVTHVITYHKVETDVLTKIHQINHALSFSFRDKKRSMSSSFLFMAVVERSVTQHSGRYKSQSMVGSPSRRHDVAATIPPRPSSLY